MAKDIRFEHDGRRLIKHCEKMGADTRWGKGDHKIVSYKGSQEVIPARPLGHGLQSKIVKWMVKVGLVVSAILLITILI